MSDRKLRLEVVLQAIDKATRPIRGILNGNQKLRESLKGTRDELDKLKRIEKTIENFNSLRERIGNTAEVLKAARARLRAARVEIEGTAEPTAKMTRELDRASKSVLQLRSRFREEREALKGMHAKLAETGISTRTLDTYQTKLRADIDAANASISEQKKRLGALAPQQKKIAAARERMQRTQGVATNMAVSGYATRTVGSHILGGVRPAIDEAKEYQREVSQFRALGIGESSLREAITFANSLNVKGLSQRESLKLLKEAYSITRDMHHAEQIAPMLARMRVGIEAVMARGGFGEGHGESAENMVVDLVKTAELRGSLKSPEAFRQAVNDATKAYIASGGLVKPEDLLNAIKTGGIAAKQLGDNSFYFGLLHTMQEMGGFRAGTGLMTAYSNWVQGRTTQQSAEELVRAGLIDPNAVKYGKTGHVTKLLPDALKQVELYKTDPFEYLMKVVLPQINPDGKLSDHQVISRIGQLFSGRKGGDLMASLFLERANILKHRAAAPQAFGVDQVYAEANSTSAGKEMDGQARVADLKLALGKEVLPLYARTLELTTGLIKATTQWANAHPMLAKILMVVAAVLGSLLVVMGSITIALAAVLGPLAMVTFAASALGVSFGAVLLAAGTVAAGIAVVAAAGVAIYRYWEPITGFFQGLWAQIQQAFAGGISAVGALLLNWSPLGLFYQALSAVFRWFGVELPGKFTEFGAHIILGLIDGITGMLSSVRNVIVNTADSVVGWFKEKLGIHSPSRVFAELGGFTMAGLNVGLTDGQEAPLATLQAFIRRLTTVGAGVALGTALPALSAVPVDNRPPLSATRSAGAGTPSGAVVQPVFNIYPALGMDEARLAQLIAQKVEELGRKHAADRRGRLADID